MGTIKTFSQVDRRSLERLERCMEAGDADPDGLRVDHHPACSRPIGGGIDDERLVSSSGRGYGVG